MFRDFVLLFYGGVILYSILFALILLGQWYKDKYRSLVNLRLSWSIFFFGMAINSAAFMLSSFWFTSDPIYTYFVAGGYVALTLALTAFFFAMERILPYSFHHGFTILGIASAIVTLIAPPSIYEFIALFIAILALIGIMSFLRYAFRNTTGNVRRNVKAIVAGFLIAWVGFIGRSDFTYLNFGATLYSIGTLFLLIGGIIFGYALTYSVALDELDWRNQLVGLYVIQEGGLLVFHHAFVEDSDGNEALTAAGMSGVQSLFQEIIRTEEGLNVVSIGNNEILFSHRGVLTCVLVVKEPYYTLMDKADEFIARFVIIFGALIGRFSGSLNDFDAAQELVQEFFYEK